MRGLFVTGTDTAVGKTHVMCLIAEQMRQQGSLPGLYKPVCSGADIDAQGQPLWDDVERLHAALRGAYPREPVCPQCFRAPLAPPIAAAQEHRQVDVGQIDAGLWAWSSHVDHLLIEGAGGWLCPLTETNSFADWVAKWQLPVLIVARRGLGTINHTLLTMESIQRRQLPIVGVILNQSRADEQDSSIAHNAREITSRSGIPVLGEIPWGAAGELLHDGCPVTVHWSQLMGAITPPITSQPV